MMGLEFFLFALMVFGMVLVVLYMVLRAKQQKQAEGMNEQDWAKREEKLMMLYFEVDDMINGLKEYVENARQVTQLEYGRVEALMTAAAKAPAQPASPPPKEPVQAEEPALPPAHEEPEPPVQKEMDRRERYDMATQLLKEKVAPERIAEELHLSSSEIVMLQKLAGS